MIPSLRMLCFMFMFYIINVFILWQPDSIRSWDGITWWQREGEGIDGCRVAVNGRWQQAEAHRHSCLPPFCCSVHYYYSCSLSDGRGDVEGRMVEWGRAGLLSDWARGRRGRKPLSRWLRHRRRRRREKERERESPQDVSVGSRGGGGGGTFQTGWLDGPSNALMEHGPGFRILPLPWVCFGPSVCVSVLGASAFAYLTFPSSLIFQLSIFSC